MNVQIEEGIMGQIFLDEIVPQGHSNPKIRNLPPLSLFSLQRGFWLSRQKAQGQMKCWADDKK